VKAGLVAAWLAGEAIVIWRVVHNEHRIPAPGVLLGISGLFLAGAVIADVWPASTTLVTVGLVGLDVAALLNVLPGPLGGEISKAQESTAQAEGQAA
jgi:hypothetical protein